ncbi:MAG: protein kinase, partial [Planctomycetaceae bacterium]|nr:protein kinase [Planctomycetaceae bacterium]
MPDHFCPFRDQLLDWVRGALADSEAEQITIHLDQCHDCEAVTDRLQTEETLVTIGRPSVEAFTDEPACRELVSGLLSDSATTQPAHAAHAARVRSSASGIRDYELLEYLGGGGMGQVFRARHVPLNRCVAIKLLPEDRSADQRLVERFAREIRAVGSLQHPNIVQAFDAGESNGRWFLAMELLDGTDLAVLLRNHAVLSVSDACEIVRRAAVGLQSAHQQGLVHRDIKPA